MEINIKDLHEMAHKSELVDQIYKIIEAQGEFQKLCGIDFDNIGDKERYAVAEVYVFKAIEELIELRKTFPSTMNSYAKNQILAGRKETVSELVDTFFFLINFSLAMGIDTTTLVNTMNEVQTNNFAKLRSKLDAKGGQE